MARFNFEGWNFWAWLKGNKEFLKVIIPAVIAFAVTNNWISATIAGIISKPILDIIEYWASK